MPNISVQFRRGTDTEHSSFTGAVGEVTVDTTNDTLRVHDGSTAGGIRLAKLSEAGGSGTVTSVDSGTGLTGGPITTSGTLSIAAGGVGTTQIADNGVTFAKMQDINTAKVIGRTTAGSGDPEEVSILDEDAMTSDSATALATQQSIKAYVDARTVSKYNTGWVSQDDQGTPVSLANGAELVFTHNLGSTEVSVQMYASDASQTIIYDPKVMISGTSHYGAQVTGLTTNTVSVRLAKNGAAYLIASSMTTAVTWGTGNAARIKLIITK
jgi:hypothetical protein